MSPRNGKLCGNCCFWEAEKVSFGLSPCHRNPPSPTWPVTHANDWCGCWEPEAPAVRREREAADSMDGLA